KVAPAFSGGTPPDVPPAFVPSALRRSATPMLNAPLGPVPLFTTLTVMSVEPLQTGCTGSTVTLWIARFAPVTAEVGAAVGIAVARMRVGIAVGMAVGSAGGLMLGRPLV